MNILNLIYMSHTKRIYNIKPLLGGPGLKGWLTSKNKTHKTVTIADKTYLWAFADEEICHDYIYRPHGLYCMGHCHHCRNWRLRSRRRQAWKQEERRAAYLDSDWDWLNEIRSSSLNIPNIWEDLVREDKS